MLRKLILSISLLRLAHAMEDHDLELAMKLSQEAYDQQLALQLQHEDEYMVEPFFLENNDRRNAEERLDSELANKLEGITIEKERIYAKAQDILKPLILLSTSACDVDVHEFNRKMDWKKNYRILNELHNNMGFDTPYVRYTPQVFFELFQKTPLFVHLAEEGKQNFELNRQLLLKHIAKNNCEGAETTASLDILLSKIWNLSCDRGDNHDRLGMLLIPIMIDNSTTGGGCYPGFAGRLCFIYLSLFNEKTLLNN